MTDEKLRKWRRVKNLSTQELTHSIDKMSSNCKPVRRHARQQSAEEKSQHKHGFRHLYNPFTIADQLKLQIAKYIFHAV